MATIKVRRLPSQNADLPTLAVIDAALAGTIDQ